MTAHSTAQGIASLGRYGDDLLVHMNQEEVQGLQALAKKHGTSLTINPDTGMPEAFKLGKVFKAILPIAAGFALGPGGMFGAEGLFGAGSFMSSALGTGLLVGGATGLLTGNLGSGLMAGLGAYGGFGLSDTLAKLGTTTAGGLTPTMAANVTQASTGAPLIGASSPFISPFTPNGIAGGAGLGLGTVGGGAAAGTLGQGAGANLIGGANLTGTGIATTGASNALTNQAMNASLTGSNALANAGTAPISGFDKSYQGLKSLFEPGGFNRAKNILGTQVPAGPDTVATTYNTEGVSTGTIKTPGTPATVKPISSGALAMKLGAAPAGALLQGVEPKDFYEEPLSTQEQKVYEQTGVDSAGKPTFGYIAKSAFNPYRTLNLSGPSRLNLGQSLQLPASTGYATGGTVQSGGVRDLYGTPDNQPTMSSGLGGFGLGRLNDLAGEQARTQAQTYGYAKGGYLNGQGDGMSDSIPATIEGKQPARLADGEFVIPADVVSHLGNGSSKAGSKRLYAMMQKVRKARTGNSRQGKQINPNNYLMT